MRHVHIDADSQRSPGGLACGTPESIEGGLILFQGTGPSLFLGVRCVPLDILSFNILYIIFPYCIPN